MIHRNILKQLYHINRISSLRYGFGIFKFNLPDLGQKIKEGTIKKIYVKEGDSIVEFDKIVDVQSDKQFAEITAPVAGVVKKIMYKEEQVCQVGEIFLQIDVKDGAQQTTTQKKQTKKQQQKIKNQQVVKQSKTVSESILATPYVRGLIKQNNLDINTIKGTGQNGRILQQDVQKLLSKSSASTSQKTKAPSTQASKPKESPPRTSSKPSSQSFNQVSMNRFQQGMQKSMTQANNIPHLYLHQQFDISQVQKMRKSLKQSNKKVTVMGMLVKTFSLALKHYPIMNSLYRPDQNPYQYHIYPNHNISIAIDSANGLVVPNIRNVNQLNLGDIQSQLERLRDLSKDGKLTGKQLQGGTICLSNIGTIGGTNACPLILAPQVCIVAIGKLQSLPRYRNGQLSQRKVINVSFGCDHRVLDGATVARFSNKWKQLIQNPYMSIAQMI